MPLIVGPLHTRVAEQIREIDRRIADVLESVRGETATWETPDRLAEGMVVPPWFELPIWLDQGWGGEPGKQPAGATPRSSDSTPLPLHPIQTPADRQRSDLPSLLVADRFSRTRRVFAR
jgi:hypothetical protein